MDVHDLFKPAKKILINDKSISLKDSVYFIAEIGSNFDGDLGRAKDLIYMAKEAGADAAKFQHYTANSLVSDQGFKNLSSKDSNSHQTHWKKSVYDTYKDASLNQEWTQILQETCVEAGISFLTSAYSPELVDLVDKYVPAYKVGSGDITWIEIIKHMSSKGKPILLATGASNMADVRRAVDCILEITPNIILLQCNTNYTASYKNFSHIHLNVITEFQKIYPGIVTGLSDHMPGHVTTLGAVALGARVIEKHFTDSISRSGPDHAFSMTPQSWREMVDRTRELENSLGGRHKNIEENEKQTVMLQRRSLHVTRDLEIGHKVTKKDLEVLRPCPLDGINPYDINKVLGKVLIKNINSGDGLKWNHF